MDLEKYVEQGAYHFNDRSRILFAPKRVGQQRYQDLSSVVDTFLGKCVYLTTVDVSLHDSPAQKIHGENAAQGGSFLVPRWVGWGAAGP